MINQIVSIAMIFTLFISASSCRSIVSGTKQTITWNITDTISIGGHRPVVMGSPKTTVGSNGSSLIFNGIDDGLIIPKIPITGWKAFTIEVLFKPDANGYTAPRFMHFEDVDLNRGTFELRITADGNWYMDTFLKNGKTNVGLTLIDSTLLHKAEKFYWGAIVYDGVTMRSYVNGKKELEGKVSFPAMKNGNLALGMRLNKIHWYKGSIKEIRFHSAALNDNKLQRL